MHNLSFLDKEGLKIAVVGSGISGILTSYLLSKKHAVTLYEKRSRLGGHTHTVSIETGPDEGMPVDMGFIVMNNKTYPILTRFLSLLDIEPAWSDMSFSFYDVDSRFMYAGTNLNGLFAQRKNIISPGFWMMLLDIARFCKTALREMQGHELKGQTLGDFLEKHRFSKQMIARYLQPMAGAIWSASALETMQFPMESFVHFFSNHGLLSFKDRPRWQYLPGGSSSYVKAFAKIFTGQVRLASPVVGVKRYVDGVSVAVDGQEAESYDAVVMASHADQTLSILEDPSEEEVMALSPWSYAKNNVILHTDTSYLPPDRRAWASWNYTNYPSSDNSSPATVSYHMNRLQMLNSSQEYIVTLNPPQPIPEKHIQHQVNFSHPQYTMDSLDAQAMLPEVSGQRRTFFCGSYHGYGFHEDGARSAYEVGQAFGIDLFGTD